MMKRRAFGLAMVLTASLGASCGPSLQEKRAASFTPSAVAVPHPAPASPIRKLRVRVYADAQHRSEVLNWERSFRALIAEANALLTTAYRVELQIVSAEEWPRVGNTVDLVAATRALAAHDNGDGADWVIGLVTQLPIASSEFHQIGMAQYAGKHIVLRRTNNLAELKAFRKQFDELSESEVERLYMTRVQHKRLVAFLHEIGHTLGAFHTDFASIMSAHYRAKISWFAPHNDELIASGLRFRGEAPVADGDAREALIKTLMRLREEGINVAAPLARLGIADEGAAEGAHAPAPTPAPAASKTNEALRLERQGKTDELRELLLAMPAEERSAAEIRHLRCRLGEEAACEEAMAAGFGGAQTAWNIAKAYRRSQMPQRESQAISAARQALRKETLLNRELRIDIARRALGIGHFSDTEDLLAPIEDDDITKALRRRLQRERRRFGFRPGAVDVAEEARAYADVIAALAHVKARNISKAQAAIRQGAARFPRLAGFASVACDLEIRRQRFAQALPHCEKAIRLDDAATWPRYLAGAVSQRLGKDEQAIAHLREAVRLETEIEGAWRLLAKLLDRKGAAGEVDALRERFTEIFERPANF